MQSVTTKQSWVIKVNGVNRLPVNDVLATEEPLEIRLHYGPAPQQQKNISVTMRTPGNDFELATGFLFTEGIIENYEAVVSAQHVEGSMGNVVQVCLKEGIEITLNKTERNFYTTSSCGVCGKASIDAVKTVRRVALNIGEPMQVTPQTLYMLPGLLRASQNIFKTTGGLHACGLFTASGKLLLAREDVGRHNAVDKLIGAALSNNMVPLHNTLLLLSGRASFELIQKAWMAGIEMVAAVGAPSSLAVEMASDCGITLIGFLRNETFNIYSGAQRVLISDHENSY